MDKKPSVVAIALSLVSLMACGETWIVSDEWEAVRQNFECQEFDRTEMVSIPGKPFKMGRTEVTQAQWKAVMGSHNNPSYPVGGDLPVENVSWDDCQEFIQKLNAKTGKKYRLPTEEEWEYACRAGGDGDWGKRANGEEGPLEAMGWYKDNSDGHTHPVGQKEPNAFGLYDMHGNVEEWTDTARGDFHVLRGGSVFGGADYCAASNRDRNGPINCFSGIGFRLVLSQD